MEEFTRVVMKAPNNRGLSGDEIPIELLKNSEQVPVTVWKLVVKTWNMMSKSKPGEKLNIPDDWMRASLVLLFKGKGSKSDPSKYRGISLLSVVERLEDSSQV